MIAGSEIDRELQILCTKLTPDNFQRVIEQGIGATRLKFDLNFAARDAGEIQQIINQPRFHLDVAANHLQALLHFRIDVRVFQCRACPHQDRV